MQSRHSPKREAIYSAVCATKSHPSAESVYLALKPEIPELSLGTVYRNLSALVSKGRLARVACVNSQERYDADMSDHMHFICRSCGLVLDVEGDMRDMGAKLPEGALIEGCQLNFYGLCANCVKGKE